jgi:plastocyanin
MTTKWLSGGLGAIATVSLLFSPLGGCSDDDPAPASGTSSGGTSGGGTSSGGTSSGGTSGSTSALCRAGFTDRTAESADRTLRWDFEIANNDARCMKIKVGQTVTFVNTADAGLADFSIHPPKPTAGAPAGSPFGTFDKTTGRVTFPSAGTFAYECGNHPTMAGAIQVE